MSYNSKRTLVSIIVGIIMIIAYIVYALGARAPTLENLKSWATAILVFIGIAIVAEIVIQILFHIALSIGITVKAQEKDDKEIEKIIAIVMAEDERDKHILLKASRPGYICAGIGFVATLAALAFGLSAIFALHVLFGMFAVGGTIEGIVSIYYYEKGVRNG